MTEVRLLLLHRLRHLRRLMFHRRYRAICPRNKATVVFRVYFIWRVLHVVVKALLTISKCKVTTVRHRPSLFECAGRFSKRIKIS